MSIHLRQICLVAAELEPVVTQLERVFGLRRGFVDPAVAEFGLHNTLLPLGTDFLEVVAPVRTGTAAGRYLERRRGDGGYMVITQADSPATHEAMRARALALGVRVAYEVDRAPWRLTQLHPGDMEAAFLEVESDDRCDFSGQWHPAGGLGWEGAVCRDRVHALCGVDLQCADPNALARRWAGVLNAPLRQRDGVPVVTLVNATLRFLPVRDERGPGLSALHLQVTDAEAIVNAAHTEGLPIVEGVLGLGGVHWYLHALEEGTGT